MMKVDLEGKTALVTGAAGGIGQSIADTLTANGARVAYTDADLKTVKEAASHTRHSLALEMDISSESDVESTVAEILEEFGRIDIPINGQYHQASREHRPVSAGGTGENCEGRFDGHLPGQQGCCPTAGRAHRQDCLDPGSCARSLAVRVTAAKAGVVQLTRALAIELAEFGILVNCVAPASTLTEGTKQLFYSENATEKERARRMLSHVPVGRPGSVEEIAHAVLFFAAPESTYITGQTLCVDGGWTAGGYLRDF
jgi:NAD(P)-dependent dehydrogenase (short-subunit alcohol dehydrogenase family)